MKSKFHILIALICLFSLQAFPQSAPAILEKTVGKVAGAGSISCDFTISSSEGSGSASFVSSGRKFRLKAPGATTWFDGKNMWTANERTHEVTLVEPSAQELKESNPFEYLSSYKSDYNVYFSKRKEAKYHLILLNPKRKGGEIKAVEIDINKSTMLPEKFIIRDRNDKITKVSISSLSLKKDAGKESFKCPVESMPDYEVIDLR